MHLGLIRSDRRRQGRRIEVHPWVAFAGTVIILRHLLVRGGDVCGDNRTREKFAHTQTLLLVQDGCSALCTRSPASRRELRARSLRNRTSVLSTEYARQKQHRVTTSCWHYAGSSGAIIPCSCVHQRAMPSQRTLTTSHGNPANPMRARHMSR